MNTKYPDTIIVSLPNEKDFMQFNTALRKAGRGFVSKHGWSAEKFNTAVLTNRAGNYISCGTNWDYQKSEYNGILFLNYATDYVEIHQFLGLPLPMACPGVTIVPMKNKEITEQDLAREVCIENFWIQLERALATAGGSISQSNLERMSLKEFVEVVAQNGLYLDYDQNKSIGNVSQPRILTLALEKLNNK